MKLLNKGFILGHLDSSGRAALTFQIQGVRVWNQFEQDNIHKLLAVR